MIVFTLTGNGILQRVHDLNVMTCVKEVGISINFDKHYVKLKSSTLKQPVADAGIFERGGASPGQRGGAKHMSRFKCIDLPK